MSIITTIDKFCNTGVKEHYQNWEIHLTRKLNILSLAGVINVAITVIFFTSIGLHDFTIELIATLIVGPFVIVLNKFKNYVWAAYLFYIIGIFLFYIITLKMGLDTLVILFYFPILISLVQVFGRKETLKHLFIISALFFVSILFLAFSYKYEVLHIEFEERTLGILKVFNIISSFVLATSLILILTTEHIKQESFIKNMLHDKEVLLAEVFHRVKNNMNIVTSLLNLKKHASESQEVKDAIEECRERVYSMALVHQKIYNNKSIHSLDFKDYINDLVHEAINSIGGEDKVDVIFNTEQVDLPLNYAIPCGLILNELITNSFKHAQSKDKKLKIEVGLINTDGLITLSVKDNGPGFDFNKVGKQNSLGMDLIKSLSEQIEAKFSMIYENGTIAKVEFRKG